MRAFLVFMIALVGVAAIVLGVVYLVVPAHSLPSFIPGHLAGANGKHPKRAYVCFGVGAVLVIASILIGMAGQPRRHGSLR